MRDGAGLLVCFGGIALSSVRGPVGLARVSGRRDVFPDYRLRHGLGRVLLCAKRLWYRGLLGHVLRVFLTFLLSRVGILVVTVLSRHWLAGVLHVGAAGHVLLLPGLGKPVNRRLLPDVVDRRLWGCLVNDT